MYPVDHKARKIITICDPQPFGVSRVSWTHIVHRAAPCPFKLAGRCVDGSLMKGLSKSMFPLSSSRVVSSVISVSFFMLT